MLPEARGTSRLARWLIRAGCAMLVVGAISMSPLIDYLPIDAAG